MLVYYAVRLEQSLSPLCVVLYTGAMPGSEGQELGVRALWQLYHAFCVLLFAQLAVFRPGTYQVTDYLLSWTYPDLSSLHDARPGPPLVSALSFAAAA